SGEPAAVGGVPPDYFSELGQLWGNPVYDWQALQQTDFAWWLARGRAQLARLDPLRNDHLPGPAAPWGLTGGARPRAASGGARSGAWLSTPGEHLLHRLREAFPDMPLVAEDLGVITEDVLALKNGFGLPGMRVLQFGFDGAPDNVHVPYRHVRECVVYTGTHDNDTTLGWYTSLDPDTRQRVDFYLRVTPGSMPKVLNRAALGSVGELA